MYGTAGFRSHKVFENVTEGVLDTHGSYLCVEVTAAAATKFYPNPKLADGQKDNPQAPQGIPIAAGQTRLIPMAIQNFKADAAVTVVAYRS